MYQSLVAFFFDGHQIFFACFSSQIILVCHNCMLEDERRMFKVCLPDFLLQKKRSSVLLENNEMISSLNDSRLQRVREGACVVTWDEAPMTSKAVLSSMEDVCRLSMQSATPFGGLMRQSNLLYGHSSM